MKDYFKLSEKLYQEQKVPFYQQQKKQMFISAPYLDEGNVYYLLKSYNTIVAIVDLKEQLFVDLGKWSVTTTKHANQFYKMFNNDTIKYDRITFID